MLAATCLSACSLIDSYMSPVRSYTKVPDDWADRNTPVLWLRMGVQEPNLTFVQAGLDLCTELQDC